MLKYLDYMLQNTEHTFQKATIFKWIRGRANNSLISNVLDIEN